MHKVEARHSIWNETVMEVEQGASALCSEGQDDNLRLYLRDIEQHPLLSAEEELQLAKLIAEGDQQAKQAFIYANLRLVVSVAKNYQECGVDFLDLIQEGNHGLLKAVEQFSLAKECRFSTYATWWIKERIRWALSKQEEPMISLYTTEEDGEVLLIDTLQDENIVAPEETITLQEMRTCLKMALAVLTEREQQVLAMRYGLNGGEGRTYAEIAHLISVSKARVRQIERAALEKLRSCCESAALKEYWAALNIQGLC